ncbi:HAD-IA family hydrolase [Microbacterium sp. C5A9]|uniref:HAD family hydrolase n=1 Tax=Microbacterium sp. C5A9 TaxID=2736663 RepID=UPI001F528113|nr:HAD-IA family hydrolase [Microbacterium sp. C5A9]MCI1020270.1 HAD-IA family hydrolase [Microbacterium sp. C5A9]
MSEPLAAVFFDLDGTLVREGAAEAVRRTAVALAERHGLSADGILTANTSAWRDCWADQGERWMRGELSGDALPRDIWQRTLERFGQDDPTLVDEAVEIHLREERATFTLFDESLEVLDALRSDQVALGLITNGPARSQRAKLAAAGIDDRFDVVIASGDIGVVKPEAEIFRHALDRLGIRAAQAAHVGDSFSADVVGAASVGMRAVWVNRDASVAPRDDVPHHECRSLRDVLALVTQGSDSRAR